MKSLRVPAITAFLIFLTCCVSLHAQEASQRDTIAIVNFGVNNPKYKAESKRIPDSIRVILKKTDGVILIGNDQVSERLMEASRVLDVFETDSIYWNTVATLSGAEVVVHGLVKPQNDSTIFVDLFVSNLAAQRVYKTALIYNPKVKANQNLGEQLRRIVDDLILYGRTTKPTVTKEEEQEITTDEHSSYRWLIGGAAIVAAAVTVFVLMADAVEPSDHNLPAPPSFP